MWKIRRKTANTLSHTGLHLRKGTGHISRIGTGIPSILPGFRAGMEAKMRNASHQRLLHAFKHADVAYGAVGVEHEQARNLFWMPCGKLQRDSWRWSLMDLTRLQLPPGKTGFSHTKSYSYTSLLEPYTAVVGTPAVYAARLGCGFGWLPVCGKEEAGKVIFDVCTYDLVESNGNIVRLLRLCDRAHRSRCKFTQVRPTVVQTEARFTSILSKFHFLHNGFIRCITRHCAIQ